MTEDEKLGLEEEFLPCPESVKKEIPLSEEALETMTLSRKTIENILTHKDPRQLLIIGPCSIHDEASLLEYAAKLNRLRQEVEDQFVIVMRVYFEKPRTLLGWKGMLYDPHLDGSHDIIHGIKKTRTLLKKIAEMGMPTASEILNAFSCPYLQDLISWACIGARTAESPIHRELASSMPMPIAFKNSTDGNIQIAVNGAIAARAPHTFLTISETGRVSRKKSKGNSYTHIVLRGGSLGPNYSPSSVEKAINLLKEADLEPSLIIDCSHGNSSRHPESQISVFESALTQIKGGTKEIKGLIMESHLNLGRQDLPDTLNELQYGLSLTDSCLDYETTESLVLKGYQFLKDNESIHWKNCSPIYNEQNLIFN